MTPARKLLSRQIKRVRNPVGRFCAFAALSTRRHMACSMDSDFGCAVEASSAAAEPMTPAARAAATHVLGRFRDFSSLPSGGGGRIGPVFIEQDLGARGIRGP